MPNGSARGISVKYACIVLISLHLFSAQDMSARKRGQPPQATDEDRTLSKRTRADEPDDVRESGCDYGCNPTTWLMGWLLQPGGHNPLFLADGRRDHLRLGTPLAWKFRDEEGPGRPICRSPLSLHFVPSVSSSYAKLTRPTLPCSTRTEVRSWRISQRI